MSFSILGTGKAVPEYVLTNDELSTMVDTNDEWIRTRTGIEERRICKDETITELCVRAANAALKDANVKAEDLDLIICSTMRGENLTPSQACMIQKEIGAKCAAFDLNAACSGFIYALDVADGYFVRKKAKYVLIVSMDNLSNITNWKDRSTCVLFGDGGAAAVLGEGDDLLSINLTAQGNDTVLRIPHGTNSSPFYEHEAEPAVLSMAGNDVYKFAVNAMSEGIKKAVADAGLQQSDVDCVIPHQANIRIINMAASKLDIPREKFFCNVEHYGNTSSGSVPIALDEASKSGVIKKGDIIALCAFGGGLTTGSCVIRWNK
ncbi:MAG: ketoacyl-ACP synthase III [Clostridia bacterium]|nr:ketoacyl-ACP synthase III [Clostridia bacterium]